MSAGATRSIGFFGQLPGGACQPSHLAPDGEPPLPRRPETPFAGSDPHSKYRSPQALPAEVRHRLLIAVHQCVGRSISK